MWLKQFKPWNMLWLIVSWQLLHQHMHCFTMWFENHTNMQYDLIWELMLYKFKLSHNIREAIKNVCSAKRWKPDQISLKAWISKPETDMASNTDNIRWTRYLTTQCGSSPSQSQQKHLELPNFTLHNQNIAKLLTHSSIYIHINLRKSCWGGVYKKSVRNKGFYLYIHNTQESAMTVHFKLLIYSWYWRSSIWKFA